MFFNYKMLKEDKLKQIVRETIDIQYLDIKHRMVGNTK